MGGGLTGFFLEMSVHYFHDIRDGGVSQVKTAFDQSHFSLNTILVLKSASLSLLEGSHDLKSFECSVSCFHRFKAQGGFDQPFEFSMIGFQPVIEVLDLSMLSFRRQFAFL